MLIKTDSSDDHVLGVTTPLGSGGRSATGFVSFTVGGDMGAGDMDMSADMMGEGRSMVQGALECGLSIIPGLKIFLKLLADMAEHYQTWKDLAPPPRRLAYMLAHVVVCAVICDSMYVPEKMVKLSYWHRLLEEIAENRLKLESTLNSIPIRSYV